MPFKKGGMMAAVALSLMGCAPRPDLTQWPLASAVPPAQVGELSKAWTSVSAQSNTQITLEGQQLRIFIPSKALFRSYSTHLLHPQSSLLQEVSHLLRLLHPVSVQVVGYSSALCDPRQDQAISEEQARLLAKALWSLGLESRTIVGIGKGRHFMHEIHDRQQYLEINAWLSLRQHVPGE